MEDFLPQEPGLLPSSLSEAEQASDHSTDVVQQPIGRRGGGECCFISGLFFDLEWLKGILVFGKFGCTLQQR